MTLQRRLNDAALDAFAAAVNQANLPQASRLRGSDVLVDHRCYVSRCERMKIEHRLDRDAMRVHGPGNRRGVAVLSVAGMTGAIGARRSTDEMELRAMTVQPWDCSAETVSSRVGSHTHSAAMRSG